MSNSEEWKFKIGDKVVRVDAGGGWDEEVLVGHCYTVLNEEIGYINVLSSDKYAGGWLMGVRFELYEEKEKEINVEQLRDEVVRIDKRIEEANKDIENAQKERESLVEKIREKGFELTRNEDSSEDVEQNNIVGTGDTVRIVKYTPAFHDREVLAEVLTTDDSNRPYYVKTDNGFSFWCRVDEVEKI